MINRPLMRYEYDLPNPLVLEREELLLDETAKDLYEKAITLAFEDKALSPDAKSQALEQRQAHEIERRKWMARYWDGDKIL
jgi:hypothetical protein